MTAFYGSVDLDLVSRVLSRLLARRGKSVLLHDRASGIDFDLSWDEAASPRGLLPAFLVAGQALWLEATGSGFGLEIVERPQTLLGYVVHKIDGGCFSSVMLSVMEAIAQIDVHSDRLMGNDLMTRWAMLSPPPEAPTTASASPSP